jgi:hypothetical protein
MGLVNPREGGGLNLTSPAFIVNPESDEDDVVDCDTLHNLTWTAQGALRERSERIGGRAYIRMGPLRVVPIV